MERTAQEGKTGSHQKYIITEADMVSSTSKITKGRVTNVYTS